MANYRISLRGWFSAHHNINFYRVSLFISKKLQIWFNVQSVHITRARYLWFRRLRLRLFTFYYFL